MTDLIEYERNGQTYATTIKGFLEELTYRCYAYNRRRSPDITPEGWGQIFPAWQTYEQRYQQEGV